MIFELNSIKNLLFSKVSDMALQLKDFPFKFKRVIWIYRKGMLITIYPCDVLYTDVYKRKSPVDIPIGNRKTEPMDILWKVYSFCDPELLCAT